MTIRKAFKPSLLLLLCLVLIAPACFRGRAAQRSAASSQAAKSEQTGLLGGAETTSRLARLEAPKLPPPYRVGIVWLDKPDLLTALEFESHSRVLAAEVKRSHLAHQVFAVPSILSSADDVGSVRQLGRHFQADMMLILSMREDTRRRLNATAFGYLTVIGTALVPGDTTSRETLIEAFAVEPQSGVFLFTATGAGKATRAGSMLTLGRNRKWTAAKAFEEAVQDLAAQINDELIALAERNRTE